MERRTHHPGTPPVTNSAAIQFADFFGMGTTAVVWSYDRNLQPDGNYKVLDSAAASSLIFSPR